MSFRFGSRVKLNADLSTTLTSGSSGEVVRVMTGGRYGVEFDKKPDGSALTPNVNETVMERYLEAAE